LQGRSFGVLRGTRVNEKEEVEVRDGEGKSSKDGKSGTSAM